MLAFTFRMEPREYLRVSREFGRYAPAKSWAYAKLAFTLTIFVAALLWLYRSEGEFPWLTLVTPLLLIVMLVGGIIVANRFKAARTGADVRDQTRILSDTGLEIRNVRNVHVPWSSMPRVCETTEFFLFYVANTHGHYLPKRAIQSQTDLEAVRALLQRELTSRFIQLESAGAT